MSLEVPRVVKDPDLREFTSGLTARPEIVGLLMQVGGVSLEEIPEHTIHFSAARGQEQSSDGIAHYGKYEHGSLTTTVYMGSHYDSFVHEYQYWLEKTGRWPAPEGFTRDIRKVFERDVNDTVLHETKHAIDHHVMGSESYRDEQLAYNVKQLTKLGCLGDIGLYGGASAALYGLYEFSSMGSVDQTTKPMLYFGGGVTAIYGFQYLFKRHVRNPMRRHKQYLSIPGEIRAREYANEQLEAIEDPSQLPVRFKFKIPKRDQLAS